MYVLTETWENKYLDYALGEGEVRVSVFAWAALAPVAGQYFERPKDWRMLWNYAREIGPRAVVNKIRSRMGERERNQKFLSIGFGVVLDSDARDSLLPGDTVAFLAYNHPRCVDCVSIDRRFVIRWRNVQHLHEKGEVLFLDLGVAAADDELLRYAGWSPHAGVPAYSDEIARPLAEVAGHVSRRFREGEHVRRLSVEKRRVVQTFHESTSTGPPASGGSVRAALFGYGNYAKTSILPHLNRSVQIERVHEVDPLQLGVTSRWACDIDTAPFPSESRDFGAYFIAGYHHTHTDIALHALSRDAYAVVEKPICTTRTQFEKLRAATEAHPGRLFACFHKRYSELNAWAREDLALAPGQPVNYHSVVYEVPLPERHWYNWPNSGSRIISNGCHWIDHFMYVNAYAPALHYDIREAMNGDVLVFVKLENGAVFSMVLTDHGSERLGVRDHIELRAGNVTVTMTDGGRYSAENSRKVLRRRRVNRMDSYGRMYREISTRIAAGLPGDSLETLRSSELVIDLEELLQSHRSNIYMAA